MQATVVGSGVSGLTCAISLRQAGWDVAVVTRELHPETVSVVAAAVWTVPSGEPLDDVRRWALVSHARFGELAGDDETGVRRLRQRELDRHDPGPSWWDHQPMVRRLDPHELPDGYTAGTEIDGFVIEPPRYLMWLTRRLAALGVPIRRAALERLDDVPGDLVVNCTGLGAADLAGDDTLFPIRGQVVAVANPGITDAVSDESDQQRIAYVYPRSTDVVLGGTRQAGRTDTDPDAAETERILADTAVLDPRVAGSTVVAVRVGLRPGRPGVRVEAGRLADGRPVMHDYGHGGQGYLLSWGCAADVVALASAVAADRR